MVLIFNTILLLSFISNHNLIILQTLIFKFCNYFIPKNIYFIKFNASIEHHWSPLILIIIIIWILFYSSLSINSQSLF